MKNRHAIILAAGAGSRLGDLTVAEPKWLLPVGRSRIADAQLRALAEAGIEHVLVVAGHGGTLVADFVASTSILPISVVLNPHFDRLNNWYSLLLALRVLERAEDFAEVLVVNSDLWAPGSWLTTVFRSLVAGHGARLAVDTMRPLTAEAMKVAVTGPGQVLSRIGKVDVPNAIGEYVGALVLDGQSASTLMSYLEQCETDATRSQEWYEHAIDRSTSELEWTIVPVPEGGWVEIDDPDDLARAQGAARR